MKFCKIKDSKDEIIECKDLNNDVLVRRMPNKIEEGTKIKINDGQYAILIENGKVVDSCYEVGIYIITNEKCENNNSKNIRNSAIKLKNVSSVEELEEFEYWDDYEDEKTLNLPLSLIFINLNEITDNKFYIKNPIPYEDWTNLHYDEKKKKNLPYKTSLIGDGKFNFIIKNPSLFLSSTLGIREHYTKQELIEQIRKTVVNSITEGINELGEEYKLSIQLVKNQTNELEIKVKQNNYDEKLAKRGIKLTYFEITNCEEIKGQDGLNCETTKIKKLFNQLYNASKNSEFVDSKNVILKVNEEGKIIATQKSFACSKCDAEIFTGDVYCKNCGAKIKK